MKAIRSLSAALAALAALALLAPALHAQDALIQPTAITSSTSGTDFFPVGNLINGSGLSGTPTLAALGTHSPTDSTTAWVTTGNYPNDYFTVLPQPVLTCTMPQRSLVSGLVIWGYGGPNEAKSFTVEFSTDGTNYGNAATVTQSTVLGSAAALLSFPGGPREATHVKVTVTDNYYVAPGTSGGDRVGLGEIRFVGQLRGQVIVRNLDNTSTGNDILDTTSATPDKVAAHAFTTGPVPLVLGSITLRLSKVSTNNPIVRVTLRADNGTLPGAVLLDLGTLSITNGSPNVTWNAAPGTAPTLAPGTRYWVTVRNEAFPTVCYWGVTSNGAFTGSGTLTTARAVSTDGGANWADATDGNTHLLQVTGVSPFLVTNTNDSGPGSLRQAMADADAIPGADTITFAPALSGQTITLTSNESSGTAIDITSDVTVDASALAGGVSISGGNARRIFYLNSGSKLTLLGLTLANGSAPTARAGAIWNNLATLTLTRCTLSNNSAGLEGGAIFSATSSGFVTSNTRLTHCTLAGNTATIRGGAIYNNIGRVTLLHCTVSGNTALAGQGSGVASWGENDTETVVQNCIIAGNVNSDVDFVLGDGTNSFTSQGYNLIGSGNATTSPNDFNQPGDLINVAPQLAPLGNYGGPTQTRPPLAGSPAIDAATVVAGLTTDQRGASLTSGPNRDIGPARDIGAVELGQMTVTTAADENNGLTTGGISLREAIAHNVPFEAELIRFAPAVFNAALPATNTITLGSEITVTRSVFVDAGDIPAGVTLTDAGGATYRLLKITGSTVSLRGLTFKDGGISIYGNSSGGAIFSSNSTVTIERCTFTGNIGDGGGAIYNENGPMTLRHCTLSGNTTSSNGPNTGDGGAIFNNNSAMSLTHCTVVGNTAPTGNTGTGGIMGYLGTVTLTNCIVAGNTITNGTVAGDVRYHSSTLVINGTNIIPASTSAGGTLTNNGTILTAAPNLAPLGNYGGSTRTRPPLANSPAIDAASAVAGLLTDQRGLPRASGPAPDIGAVELQEIRVNTLADQNDGIGVNQVSLREALTSTAPGVAEVVRFAPAVFNATLPATNTIALTTASGGEIAVTKSVLVDAGDIAAGVTLDGGAQNFRLILMQSGSNLALRGLTLANGRTPSSGGAITNSNGTLTLTRCTLSGNFAFSGGAIYSFTASITGSITSSSTLTHCTLSGNTATSLGGAIHNESGRTTLLHCTVSGNTAPTDWGSGVASAGYTNTETVVQNSIIAGNGNSDVDFVDGATNSFASQGYNRIGSGNATGDFIQTGDSINNTSATIKLAPLGDYGGPTRTMLPLPGSPAIDAATTSTATTDQRGFLRPVDGDAIAGAVRDIGAAEYTPASDLPAFWLLDTDGDGRAFGVERALGTNLFVSDPAATGNLTAPAFNLSGDAELTFGLNAAVAPHTIWILKRSTTLLPGSFVEIYRFHGPSEVETLQPGIDSDFLPPLNPTAIKVTDQNPPAGKAFYRFEAQHAP